jgi:cytochrome b561
MSAQRYHPLLVALHWLVAVLIALSLIAGFFGLAQTPNSDPTKLDVLRWHMASGAAILGLMLVRLVVRLCTAQPPQGKRRLLHYAFYVVVIGMGVTGFATTLLARLNDIVFAHSGEPLPPDLHVYPTRVLHGYLALLLVALLAWHLALAVPRMTRMVFGPR